MVSILLADGCTTQGPVQQPRIVAGRTSSELELQNVPFFPQKAYQCGPAALATVLAASGIEVTPGELEPKIYLPQRRGSLQLELLAASRRYERLPYVIDAEFPDPAKRNRAVGLGFRPAPARPTTAWASRNGVPLRTR